MEAYRNRMQYMGHLYNGQLRPEDYAGIEGEFLWFVERLNSPDKECSFEAMNADIFHEEGSSSFGFLGYVEEAPMLPYESRDTFIHMMS